ncbi:MAG: hypothetical protein ACIAQF_01430 [Phycisphaerales bacterium JB065]
MRPTTLTAIVLSAATLAVAAASNTSLIRPDSATAQSEFNGSYDIGNAIDGSGLPEDFTPADPHETYVVNNHWTTRSGAIAAETARATFFFDTAQDLGRFYMWNHRSNNIASDPFYEVIRFDLIFRDADGVELYAMTDVPAVGETAVAQTFCFPEVQGVRSVEFIILENQGSIYTGLAEVAFGDASPSKCLGDANFNGTIDLADLNALLAAFGQPVSPCTPRDTNGDGMLDLADLNYILANFGSDCPE